MSREEYIKSLIKKNGLTIKDFALKIEMPYSTLLTMLNENKLGSAAIDSVIRICHGLGITVEDLQEVLNSDDIAEHLVLSEHEKKLIENYRQKEDLQKAVDLILLTDDK